MGKSIIVILDGFGVGEAPDAAEYGDVGSNTLKGIYDNYSLNVPNLKKLGLYNIEGVNLEEKENNVLGAFGKAEEKTKGKNSPVGHWEIMGYIKTLAFSTFENGFPQILLDRIAKRAGIKGFICNEKGSGTYFLEKYGEESIEKDMPIVYTSADSVFQIAAHEDKVPVERLYEICQAARDVIDEDGWNIGTVIARPFVGTESSNFKRTYNRRDYEAANYGKTVLDTMIENCKKVFAIGKIEDLFVGRGITDAIHTNGNEHGIDLTIEAIKEDKYDMIFTNLVDFDMLYGHRNNIEGFGKALEYFDSKLPEIMESMKDDDILIITADHGNDPSTPSTDHSREYIPILVYGKNLKANVDLGTRKTYADIGQTLTEFHGIPKMENGESFMNEIKR